MLNMSTKDLLGMTSFINEYITIHRFSTKFKIKSCFLMNTNRDQESLEAKFVLFVYFKSPLPASFSCFFRPFPFGSGQL